MERNDTFSCNLYFKRQVSGGSYQSARTSEAQIYNLQIEDRRVQFQVSCSIISLHINNPEVPETLKMSLFDAAASYEIST